jgi:hypothetical protein
VGRSFFSERFSATTVIEAKRADGPAVSVSNGGALQL